MPNWCQNEWEVFPDTKEEAEEIYNLLTSEHEGNRFVTFNKIMPMPEILKKTRSGSCEIDGERVKVWIVDGEFPNETPRLPTKEEAKQIEATGSTCWYDWCCDNWGTKWDAADSRIDDTDLEGRFLCFYFDTAWSPPVGIAEALKAKFPNAGFSMFYREDGMQFAGYL